MSHVLQPYTNMPFHVVCNLVFAVQVPAVIPRAVLFKPNPPEASDVLCEGATPFVAGSFML